MMLIPLLLLFTAITLGLSLFVGWAWDRVMPWRLQRQRCVLAAKKARSA